VIHLDKKGFIRANNVKALIAGLGTFVVVVGAVKLFPDFVRYMRIRAM
jgi:hypothetical protein